MKMDTPFNSTARTRKLFAQVATLGALLLSACTNSDRWDDRETVDLSKTIEPFVQATLQTDPVKAALEEDSADDPAVWVSKKNPSVAVILGTNKKAGIHVYDLNGKEKQFLELGLINNIDVRYDFPVGSSFTDIAGCSNRTHQSIDILKINQQDGTLEMWGRFPVTKAIDEIYGFCLAKDLASGRMFAIANGKNGVIEQWELFNEQDTINAKLARTLTVPSQPEGMVSDDIAQRLFVGEEESGIWHFSLLPETTSEGSEIAASTHIETPAIEYDIEGISLYYLNETDGYLIASSQGNHSYAIFDRNPPFNYRGSFSVEDSETIDGIEETDGIDVINLPLSEIFPTGTFIAQDGYNFDTDGNPEAQNFKLVSWQSIAEALNLQTDPLFDGWR